jgi:hypothetical protein
VIPADGGLEADVLATAAVWGDQRWLLDVLGAHDFHVHRGLFAALREAHDAGTLCQHYDDAGRLCWRGLDERAQEQLRRLVHGGTIALSPRSAVERLRALSAERQLLADALDVIARYREQAA